MKNDSKGLLKRSTFSIDGRVLGPAHTPVKRVRTRAHSTKLHETSSLTKDVRSKKTNVETIRKEKKKEEGIIDFTKLQRKGSSEDSLLFAEKYL